MRRTPIVLLVTALSTASLGARAAGGREGRCSPLTKAQRSVWPSAGRWISPAERPSAQRLRLTRGDVLAIRCTLERYLHAPAALRKVAVDFRRRLRRWKLGAPALDGPRIGAFWMSLGTGRAVVLRATLAVSRGGRYGVVATLQRHRTSWRVIAFSDWRAHRRRR